MYTKLYKYIFGIYILYSSSLFTYDYVHITYSFVYGALIQQSSAYGVNVSLADVRILPEEGNCCSSAYFICNIYTYVFVIMQFTHT